MQGSGLFRRATVRKSALSNLLPASRAFWPLKLTDGDVLFVYTLALFAVGASVRLLSIYSSNRPGVSFLFEVNAGELLATFAIYCVIKEIDTAVLTRFDFAIVSISAMFFLLPDRSPPFVGATVAGLYFWRRRPYNEQLESVGQLWLAVSCYEIWGPFFFRLVSASIIKLEAFVVAAVGRFVGLGLELEGIRITSPNGWYVLIMEGCSSFHNVSLAFLVWLSLIKIGGAKLSRSKLPALGVGIVGVICLNVLRILLMTSREDTFHFWHDGHGATIFSCLTLMAIAVPTTISIRISNQ